MYITNNTEPTAYLSKSIHSLDSSSPLDSTSCTEQTSVTVPFRRLVNEIPVPSTADTTGTQHRCLMTADESDDHYQHFTGKTSLDTINSYMNLLDAGRNHGEQVISDRFKVAIRVRPLPDTSICSRPNSKRVRRWTLNHVKNVDDDWEPAWKVEENSNNGKPTPVLVQSEATRQVPGRNFFPFDNIFEANHSTFDVYQTVAKPIVNAVVTGRHGTVFAYGQTGSGKTHTMQGNASSQHNSEATLGIVQLAAMDLLKQMERNCNTSTYALHAQFFEIYNEQIRDLLGSLRRATNNDGDSNKGPSTAKTVVSNGSSKGDLSILTVREDIDAAGMPTISVNAHEEPVKSIADVELILRRGNRNRISAATAMNAHSSRSHAIFRLTLESHVNNSTVVRKSVLNLVDLAGSENSTQAGITGIRKKEAGKINQSLLSLSRVIHALSLPAKKRPKHIGYRDSKLTRILQPHLAGNACMAVLCCVSAARIHLEETRSTLQFAARAKCIEVKPQINEVVSDAVTIAALQKELEETRENLRQLQTLVETTRRRNPVSEKQPKVETWAGSMFVPDKSPARDESASESNNESSPMQPLVEIMSYSSNTMEDSEENTHIKSSSVRVDSDEPSKTVGESQNNECLRRTELSPMNEVMTSSGEATFNTGDISDENGDGSEMDSKVHLYENVTQVKGDTENEHHADQLCVSSVADDEVEYFGLRQKYEKYKEYSSRTLQERAPISEVMVCVGNSTSSSYSRDTLARLHDAHEQVRFLSGRLEATHDLADSLFKSLELTRQQNEDLRLRNSQLALKVLQEEQSFGSYSEQLELLKEQLKLLKYLIAAGMMLHVFGQSGLLLIIVGVLWTYQGP